MTKLKQFSKFADVITHQGLCVWQVLTATEDGLHKPKHMKEDNMDLRYNYDHIRDQIDRADFGYLDDNSQIVKDIKARMHRHIDKIEELEEQKRDIDRQITAERVMLKNLAETWDI